MRVTAIIEDNLVRDVKTYTQSDTVTEAINIVIKDWLDIYAVKALNAQISQKPITIKAGNTIREINRQI